MAPRISTEMPPAERIQSLPERCALSATLRMVAITVHYVWRLLLGYVDCLTFVVLARFFVNGSKLMPWDRDTNVAAILFTAVWMVYDFDAYSSERNAIRTLVTLGRFIRRYARILDAVFAFWVVAPWMLILPGPISRLLWLIVSLLAARNGYHHGSLGREPQTPSQLAADIP